MDNSYFESKSVKKNIMSNLLSSFSESDFNQIENKGISKSLVEKQIKQFVDGIPAAKIVEAATIDNGGIKKLNENSFEHYLNIYDKNQKDLSIVKFVPASGAATRMFKDLFSFLNNSEDSDENIDNLVKNIKKLALFEDLKCVFEKHNLNLEEEIENKNFKKVIELIIAENGLNYGNLPKGLLKFHKYNDENRTAFEEHVSESLLYANSDNKSRIHFTVSPEHQDRFDELAEEIKKKYSFTNLDISFSTQASSTDTIALTPENEPFRNDDGTILFRPGGHGALIYNLDKIDSDIIFIKNIDNVVPNEQQKVNCKFKKTIAGVLLETQKNVFDLINLLQHNPSMETIQEAFDYIVNKLSVKIFFEFSELSGTEKIEFLLSKLDRPIRICAMVKNEGEPGGGPFFVMQKDKTATLQIVEKAQIDLSISENKEIFDKSTHFNPVDIVLSPKRYNSEKFDLTKFIDPETGFISEKSKDGKNLKALELPGLWNGAMANFSTLFVEVPLHTFNPVKTIFDLLRDAHQNK